MQNIRGFDGIRGLAVMAVVVTHLPVLFWLTRLGLPPSVLPMIQGATGVQAFFVLSGFLITTILIEEMEHTGTVSIRRFMLRRALRILPLYLLFLVASTLLHVFGRNVTTWESLWFAYAYAYNFVPREVYTSFKGHTWSLAVEEHFYLIWPAVFLVVFRRSRAALLGLLVSFIITVPVLRSLFADLDARFFVDRWSFIAGYPIAIGCTVAVMMTGRNWRTLFARREAAWLGLLLYGNSLFLATDPFGMDTLGGSGYLRAFGVGLLIGWVFCNQDSWAVRKLETRLLAYIGKISYGVYIYQGLFLSSGPWREPSSSWPPPQWIGFPLLLVIAPLSFRYLEQPFLRLKTRIASRAEAPQVQPEPLLNQF